MMFLFLTGVLFPVGDANAVRENLPKDLRDVDVKQKLGTKIDLSLPFVDHEGRPRKLSHYWDGKQPVILTLNYYRCPMLCTLQLNSLVEALDGLNKRFSLGFRIVTISINHREGPKLAASKRKNYLKQLKQKKIHWDFLTGQKKHIEALAGSLGFRYRYVAKNKQYAHPAVIFFLTPGGKVSQYLGMPYYSRDIKFSLMTASQGRLGSMFEKLIMSCFIYNSTDGQYTPFAYGIVRLGGVLTVIVLALMLIIFWMRERQRVEKLT